LRTEDIYAYEKAGITDEELVNIGNKIGRRFIADLSNRDILVSESFEFLLEILDYLEEQQGLV